MPGVRLSGSDRRRLREAGLTPWGTVQDVPEDDADIDPARFFETDGPVEVEVGCGKGSFLVAAAEAYPAVNFLGVELAEPFARGAAARMVRRSLENVRVLCGDAGRLIREQLRAETVTAVHVYFPDPWPKKRHHKRRIFNRAFLDGVERVLIPGGRLAIATDYGSYYERMRELCDADGRFEPLCAYEWTGGGGVTNFERKYLAGGRTSHRASYRKRVISEEASRI